MMKRVYYTRQTAGSAGFLPLQIPRFLVSNDTPAYAEIAKMSNDAKVLYSLLLDRLNTNEMSAAFLENPWHNDKRLTVKLHGGYDEQGNAYVHFSLAEMQEQLGLHLDSVVNVLMELVSQNMILIVEQTADEPRRIYPLTPALIPTASSA